jgi:hypothetical protein
MLDKLCRNSSHLEKLLKEKLKVEEDLKIFKWLQQDKQDVVEEWHKTVAWMRQVTNQTGYQCDTFALSVHVLDNFLGLMKIHGKYLKCAAASSVYIASKIQEEKDCVHTLESFLAITNSKFTVSDITRMEKIILEKIGWELVSRPTSATFLEIYFNLLCANHFETVFGSDSLAYSIYRSLASQLEHCYCEPTLQAFHGSVKSLSLLSCTMEKITSRWFLYIDPLARLSEINIQDLLECRELIKINIFGIQKPQKPKLHRPRKYARRTSQFILPSQSRSILSPIVENPFESEFNAKQQQVLIKYQAPPNSHRDPLSRKISNTHKAGKTRKSSQIRKVRMVAAGRSGDSSIGMLAIRNQDVLKRTSNSQKNLKDSDKSTSLMSLDPIQPPPPPLPSGES